MLVRFVLSMILAGALAFGSSPALAVTVFLDGVDNATWSANPTTYLYVAHADSSGYYYQWTSGSGSLPSTWTSLDSMVQDLVNNQTYVGNNDWKIESGGDPFNNPNAQYVWKTLTLPAGHYTLGLAQNSEAYNLKSYQWPGETVQDLNIWNAYVQIEAIYQNNQGAVSFAFGGFDGYWQSTEAGALNYYQQNVDGMQITLDHPADVYFFINDYNSVDNAKSVTLEINAVPLPGSLYFMGPGLAMLLAGLWRRRLSLF
jgi:hypothetical protein